jgi:hypothetical protein
VKVLGMLSSLVDTALDRKRLKIYFTGEKAAARVPGDARMHCCCVTSLCHHQPSCSARAADAVFCWSTGHSLGGAVATLAAYDLLKKYKGELDPLRQVRASTFCDTAQCCLHSAFL